MLGCLARIGAGSSGSPSWPLARARHHRLLLSAVVLAAVLLPAARGQDLVWESGYPKLEVSYDWTITKSTGAAVTAGTGAALTVARGGSVEIPYTVTVTRDAGSAVGTLAFKVTCPLVVPGQAVTISGAASASGTTGITAGTEKLATFANVPFTNPPKAPDDTTVAGTITVSCGGAPGPTIDVRFTAANAKLVRDTATLTDVITWPTWSTYFPAGGWLTTPPTTAVSRGVQPSGGVTVKGSETFEYAVTVSNILLCFSGAPINNVATLVAGKSTDGQRTYTATAAATLAVTGCDIQPAIVMDQPNLQTSLTFAWSQAITPVTSPAIRVPWGGGGSVEAQAVFTRTVTSATFLASFTLTVTNPATAPMALTNLQLSCPWGGNTLLPCGAVAAGGAGIAGTLSTNQWLVIPASGSVQCMVNNLQLAATWGSDFTQPCTIITSNWLGTQTTLQNVVLDFSGPTRWQLINNCATWSVTCNQPSGNPLYLPAVGGLPSGKLVCGNDQSNQPLPPQPFSIALSGGWIGDGTVDDGLAGPVVLAGQQQPVVAARTLDPCANTVTTTCTSQLQLQNTQGTTQAYGGQMSNTITIQATPVDCPRKPPPQPVLVVPPPVVPPAPLGLMSTTPVITAAVTKTIIKGAFTWSVSTQLTPAEQAVAQDSAGVLGTYTVTAAPTPVTGSEPQYQLQGVVSVQNPAGNNVPMTLQQVNVVVDTAQVALVCPGIPGSLSPGQVLQCPFLVNYNQGPAPNAVFGRVTDSTGRTIGEGPPAPFTFDSADATGARGGCARVFQTYATNWFDLVQVSGVAPSFTGEEPTTVCSPATWRFDVRFTPRRQAPCGVQQVQQTVTASYTSEAAAQARSMANLYVTGPSCSPPPAEFLLPTAGGTTAPAPTTSGGGSGPAPTTSSAVGGTSAPTTTTSTTTTGTSSSSGGGAGDSEPLPAGLSVVVSDVQQQRSASPAWELSLEPADNVTFTPGKAASVGFKLSWSKTKPSTDYTATVTVTNNAPDPAELDGLYVNLLDTLGSGDATDEALPDCPVDASGSLQPITGASPFTVPAFGRLSCKVTLRSVHSGALVGTATLAEGGDGIVSKQVAVTSLMGDSSCRKLVYGAAATELVPEGVLYAGGGPSGGWSEEDVCTAGSKVVRVNIPADAKTDKGCSYPVVTSAWIKPSTDLASPGTFAFAKSDVKVAGCSSSKLTATAGLAGVSLSKGRALRWVVSIETDPPVSANETFEGESLAVNTTWKQTSEDGLRLNVSGEVSVRGSGSVTKAKVLAIPLCGASAGADCKPVLLEVNCKTAPDSKDASCGIFNLTRLPALPLMLLPLVDQAQPAAAQPYDIAAARYGGRPAPLCAVLSEARGLEPLDGAPAAEVAVVGAAALPTEPFCGAQQMRSYTVSFAGIECGDLYAFTTSAAARPVTPGAPEAKAELAVDVTC